MSTTPPPDEAAAGEPGAGTESEPQPATPTGKDPPSFRQRRGNCKRGITRLIATILNKLDTRGKHFHKVVDLHKRLSEQFKTFVEVHNLLHGTLTLASEIEVSNGYYADVEADVQDCESQVTSWIKQMEERGDAHKLLDEDEDEHIERRVDVLSKSTQEQFQTLNEQLSGLRTTLNETLERVLQATTAPAPGGIPPPSKKPSKPSITQPLPPSAPVGPAGVPILGNPTTSTPVKTGPKQVSWGGISRVEASQNDSTVGAILDMASSIRELVGGSKPPLSYKIHKTKLTSFSGEAIKYWPFIKAFETMIEKHTTDPGDRLQALLQHTSGDVNEMLQCCLMRESDEGYNLARKLLAEQYGDDEDVAQAWIAKIMDLKEIDNLDALRQLVYHLRSCRETLTSMNQLAEFQTKSNLKLIIDKIPYTLQERWQVINVEIKEKGRQPTLHDVLSYLQRVVKEKSDPFFGGTLQFARADRSSSKTSPKSKTKCFSTQAASGPMEGDEDLAYDDQLEQSGLGETVCALAARPGQPAGGFRQGGARTTECVVCNEQHNLYMCERFKSMSVDSRINVVRENRLCNNCMNANHFVKRCRSSYTCRICHKRHHSLLHQDDEGKITAGAGGSVVAMVSLNSKIALPIVPMLVRGNGLEKVILVLLDSGASCTLCSNKLLDFLRVPCRPHSTHLTTIHNKSLEIKGRLTELNVSSCYNGSSHVLEDVIGVEALNLSVASRASAVDVTRWPHLRDLNIKDYPLQEVDMLIGQNNPDFIFPEETRRGSSKREPFGTRTILGWHASGPIDSGESTTASCYHCCDQRLLDDRIERFLSADAVPETDREGEMSPNDVRVLSTWKEQITVHEGQYKLPIPFKENEPKFPDNYRTAVGRMRSLEKRMAKDPNYRDQYVKCIKSYLEKGFAEVVPDEELTTKPGASLILNHHGVTHPRKPGEVRVVFCSNEEHRGKSLNNSAHTGPDLLNRLVPVLTRFRQDRLAFTCDVSAMFNRVLVSDRDKDFLRFLWWEDSAVGGKLIMLRMRTHLFGGGWSPSGTNFALRHVATEFEERCMELTLATLKKAFYVDDCLKCISTVLIGVKLMEELKDVLMSRGFPLVKFASNSRELLKSLNPDELVKELKDADLDTVKLPKQSALGSWWDPEDDRFFFVIIIPENPATRRGVLSSTSSIFDPLGLLTPVILQAKLITQETCRRGYKWDGELEPDLQAEWEKWKDQIHKVEDLTFSRCFLPKGTNLDEDRFTFELHFFSDASEKAFGAVVYLKATHANGKARISLVMAKGKVAPKKQQSIPRMELCAAQVSAQLSVALEDILEIKIDRRVFWTDSSVVLHYLKNEDKRYKTYVANRVSFITQHSDSRQWRHVPTKQNPADVLSRGCTAADLCVDDQWKRGPSFLQETEDKWPKSVVIEKPEECAIEEKREEAVFTASPELSPTEKLLQTNSSWHRVKYHVAVFHKFGRYLRKKPLEAKVTVGDLRTAESAILRYVQKLHMDNKETKIRLSKLFPIRIDGLLRVGGRLTNSPLPLDAKHPVMIPDHPIVHAIIWETHLMAGHGGTDRIHYELRKRYWIVGGKRAVNSVIRKCHKCRRTKESFCSQLMSDLPEDRVTGETPPFHVTGLDFFGPLVTKDGRKVTKRYGCAFICFTTKAFHLELVSGLDTDSCLKAIIRFASRRGMPARILSDNGTNFVGASKELEMSISEWNTQGIESYLRIRGCEWRFNPPAASHMGGIWERHIRVVRGILVNISGEQTPTYEGMATLLCVIEDTMNGRPLTVLGSDDRDPVPLCANNLLRPNTEVNLPPGVFKETNVHRRRWRQIMYLAGMFWRRWRVEYLTMLQKRTKWVREKGNLKVGDVVIVRDDAAPRNHWPLARVIVAHPSKDGRVRSVTVKTSKGSLKRPIHKLCLIEAA